MDLTTETLYACKLKKTSSSVSIEPRQPDVLGCYVRETAAIPLHVQRLCLWAEMHGVMLLLLPHPDNTQRGPVSCSTSFPRKGARVWEVGEELIPRRPTAGWSRISTSACTGVVQQEGLGVYVVICLETLICLKYKWKEKKILVLVPKLCITWLSILHWKNGGRISNLCSPESVCISEGSKWRETKI